MPRRSVERHGRGDGRARRRRQPAPDRVQVVAGVEHLAGVVDHHDVHAQVRRARPRGRSRVAARPTPRHACAAPRRGRRRAGPSGSPRRAYAAPPSSRPPGSAGGGRPSAACARGPPPARRGSPAPASRTPSPVTWLSAVSGTCTVTPSSGAARVEAVGQRQHQVALAPRVGVVGRAARRRRGASDVVGEVEPVRVVAPARRATSGRSGGPTRRRRRRARRRTRWTSSSSSRSARRTRASSAATSVDELRGCARRTRGAPSSRPRRGRGGRTARGPTAGSTRS